VSCRGQAWFGVLDCPAQSLACLPQAGISGVLQLRVLEQPASKALCGNRLEGKVKAERLTFCITKDKKEKKK
jgi:hypothetical protein